MVRFLFFTLFVGVLKTSYCTVATSGATTMALRTVDFEVFGRVQGVFFRKFTKQQADKLDLKGWCRNTSRGTVEGQMQGSSDKIQEMIHWLKTTGSPSSKIDKADFSNDKEIPEITYSSFDIRRDN